MNLSSNFFWVAVSIIPLLVTSLIVSPDAIRDLNASQTRASNSLNKPTSHRDKTIPDDDLTLDDAQESTNYFASDLGAPFDTPSDYALFDNFPSLPYFPEFSEIFRISRTTTPEPFSFPDYGKETFPDRPSARPSSAADLSGKYADTVGGRRPARRPPRPASSGTRTKVSKNNHRERPVKTKVVKSRPPSKSKDYPKIFRFTSDRVNLADFDMKKKMNENYLTLAKGDELDSDKIKRNKFLILHGGVFEIERHGRQELYPSNSDVHEVTATEGSLDFK